jgi:hypothetical protein
LEQRITLIKSHRLNTSGLGEILDDDLRRAIFDNLCAHRWHALPSICDAIVDDVEITDQFGAVGEDLTDLWNIDVHVLQCGLAAQRVPGGIAVGHCPSDPNSAPAVFGPYMSIPPGRYKVSFIGEIKAKPLWPHTTLLFEIAANFGQVRYAAVERGGPELVSLHLNIEFVHDRADHSIEFRVFVVRDDPSATFILTKVGLVRIHTTSETKANL